jgi:ectoine hydroxylase-related dioxygenase (phytanoyl-CoA dioxygenase family)
MSDTREILEHLEAEGYCVLPGAIDDATVDGFWAEFEQIRQNDPLVWFADHGNLIPGHSPDAAGRKASLRVINAHTRSRLCRELSVHPAIMSVISPRFGKDVACIQTLGYSRSSEQGAHSDKFLVDPPYLGGYERETLCAAWIACESSDEENGALVIYPGSHKLMKPSLQEMNLDYGAYVRALEACCAEAGIQPCVFRARKGDVLIWHGDFVHAGGLPRDPARSRASLVCHYADVSAEKVLSHGGAAWRVGGHHIFGSHLY